MKEFDKSYFVILLVSNDLELRLEATGPSGGLGSLGIGLLNSPFLPPSPEVLQRQVGRERPGDGTGSRGVAWRSHVDARRAFDESQVGGPGALVLDDGVADRDHLDVEASLLKSSQSYR